MPASLIVERGIVFQKRYEQDLKLDVYRLKNPATQPMPALIFLHGGAWRDGRRDQTNPTLYALAERGFICIAADYSQSTKAKFPTQVYDVKAVIRWVRKEAIARDIDPNRIGLWGLSSGAHLAALAAASTGSAELTETGVKGDDSVQAVASIFGAVDLAKLLDWRDTYGKRADLQGDLSPETQLLGVDPRSNPRLNRLANPAAFVTSQCPPFLILQGINDEVVPPEQSQIMVDALRKNGVPVKFELIENLAHELRHDLWKTQVVDFFLERFGLTSFIR